MKASLLFVILMTTVLILIVKITNALDSDRHEPFTSFEYAAYSPDLPDLPQDNEFLCADVNEDDVVNVLDIISMVNYILEGGPDPFNTDAADVNADGNINVLDIISVVNIILQVPGMPCPCIPSIDYDDQTYTTVQIGDQCWLKENLNVGTMIVSNAAGQFQTDNGVIEKYCASNEAANCDIYGGLYEWKEAMQYITTEGAQGICPESWHIPTVGEWTTLAGFLGGQDIAGGKMKSTGTIEDGTGLWYAPNTAATNESGFTSLPAGARYFHDGGFDILGFYGNFWSSKQVTNLSAEYRVLYHDNATLLPNGFHKGYGFSVRCIRGEALQCGEISLIGEFSEWTEDHFMTRDDTNPALWSTIISLTEEDDTFGSDGIVEMKFREGASWAIQWGALDFPTGIGYDCGPNIPVPLDETSDVTTYNVTFNCGTGEYSFEELSDFTCGDVLTDNRDGQSYATVLIGDQCWMAENLNVGTMINSTSGGHQQTDNGIVEKFCYSNNPVQCDTYGGLYEWQEAMQYVTTESTQGICPDGWIIPTDNDWNILEGTVDSQYPVGDPEWDKTGTRGLDAGGNMKETGTLHWNPPNTGATNSSGFTGLPGGYRSTTSGNFFYLGENSHFWSSTEGASYCAFNAVQYYGHAYIGRYCDIKDYGFSVRCIKDE